jgi:predicted GNAT family N-acyltransferase
MGARIRIIQAQTAEELRTAARLRYHVFVEEMGQSYPEATLETGIADFRDTQSAVFLAYDGEEAVGTMTIDWWGQVESSAEEIEHLDLWSFARAFSPRSLAVIRKAAVSRAWRSSAVFMRLIAAIVDFAYSRPEIRFVFLQCASKLLPLYERLGFRLYAPAFYYEHTGRFHLPMCYVVGDHDHLSRICSPLLRLVKDHPRGDCAAARAFLLSYGQTRGICPSGLLAAVEVFHCLNGALHRAKKAGGNRVEAWLPASQ